MESIEDAELDRLCALHRELGVPDNRRVESLTWDQVLAWRMRRQFLDPIGGREAVEAGAGGAMSAGGEAGADGATSAGGEAGAGGAMSAGGEVGAGGATSVARRLAGVQAQVMSAAELAVAVRGGARADVRRALLEERTLMKTWAMRGTLHLLPVAEAGAYLALCASVRNWEKPSWQKAFGATPADLEAIAAAATDALDGGACLTREELVTAIVDATGSTHLKEVLQQGWGPILKPLAWWGLLCHGPAEGNRVTFAAPSRWLPGWTGVPPVDAAAPVVIRTFLGAHGPATTQMFDAWLMRKLTPKKALKGWFAAMADELTTVDVEGTPMYVLTEHVDELVVAEPTEAVRLLGGFDQYVLGAGTDATYLIPAEHRAKVSRTAGWISPVVLYGGRVVGVWDGTADVTLWTDVPAAPLNAEKTRLAKLLS